MLDENGVLGCIRDSMDRDVMRVLIVMYISTSVRYLNFGSR